VDHFSISHLLTDDKSFDNILSLRHHGQSISRISLETTYHSPCDEDGAIAPEISREESQEKIPMRVSFIICRDVLQDEHRSFVFAYANR
jgi:hypothetical protein